MTVSIDTVGAPDMVTIFNGDAITNWTNSNRLSLDGFNSEIEGAGCVAISLAKNSTVTYSYTAPVGVDVPEDTEIKLTNREQVPDAAITGEYKTQAIINSYTTIGSILNTYSITINDEQTPTAGTATYDILPEFTGGTSSLTLKSFVATALDLSAGTLGLDEAGGTGIASVDFNYDVQNVNLRAVDNAFIDVGYAGSGIRVLGTTDSDSLFRETVDADINGDTHYGALQSFEGVIFAQHNCEFFAGALAAPGQVSRNENLTFVETLNGTNQYILHFDATAGDQELLGSNIQTTGNCILDCFVNTSNYFFMDGGSFKKARSVLFDNGSSTTSCRQRIQNVVFEDITYVNTGLGGANTDGTGGVNDGYFRNNTLSNISSLWIESTFENNTITNCDSVRAYNINLPTGQSLTISDCTITNSGRIDTTLQDAIIATTSCAVTNCTFDSSGRLDGAALFADSATFNDITGCTFTRSVSTNAAVELRVDGNITLDWDNNTLTGYGTGTSGTDVASTANGAIAANFISNSTLTLNVTNGSTVPTVEKIGTGTVNIVNNAVISLTRLLGNTEISVLDNPSPYSATSLPAPAVSTVASTERVSADTNTGDGGSNYIGYSNSGGFVRITAFGTTAFTNFPGVLQDTNATNPRNLSAGDKVRVTIRDDADNPSLQLFDEFEVSGTPSSSIILTTTSFSTFTSAFGTTLNSANSKTVTVEKVDARFTFAEAAVGDVIDILAFRTGSDPVLSLENTAETGNLPLTQVGDRNYRDPA